MKADQFKAWLKTVNLTQVGFAQLLGCSGRTGQRWARRGPSPEAAAIIWLIKQRPELLIVLEGRAKLEAMKSEVRHGTP